MNQRLTPLSSQGTARLGKLNSPDELSGVRPSDFLRNESNLEFVHVRIC